MRATVTGMLAAILLVAAVPADARGGHRHYPAHGHGHTRFGIYIGAPLLFAPWWGSYAYSPPPVVVQAPALYYGERSNPLPSGPSHAQSGTADARWYYCADTKTYYPYVQTCASPWQQVVPHAPPPQP